MNLDVRKLHWPGNIFQVFDGTKYDLALQLFLLCRHQVCASSGMQKINYRSQHSMPISSNIVNYILIGRVSTTAADFCLLMAASNIAFLFYQTSRL